MCAAPATSRAEGKLAVGMIFLPRTDLAAQETLPHRSSRSEIIKFGYQIYGWRQVPVDVAVLGDKANATRPEIEQIMIANTQGRHDAAFERDLYVIRRRIEKAVIAEQIKDFYICSLSCRSIIYKGMFLAEQLAVFYPDLLDERFTSTFAIFHQRYSTNTFPAWHLAQPFRMLAHNGEINTLRGNVQLDEEPRDRCMAHPMFGEHIEDLKPVIQPGGSDSAILDNVCELHGARRPLAAHGQDHADPRGLCDLPEGHAAGAPRSLRLCQRGDGALGRAGRDLRLWRALGGGGHGPQRPPPDALHAHQ